MIKTTARTIILFFCIVLLVQCHSRPVTEMMHYEVVNSAMVNDSLAVHTAHYKEDFAYWKTTYNECLHDSLFRDAFYLGLQTELGIGGISNLVMHNINRQITVLDTSSKGNIFNMLAINKSANCFSKINWSRSLQDSFYNELIRNLRNSIDYRYLTDLVDSNQIGFKISTLIDYSIRPDSLVGLLERTNDSSLLYFKQILLTPGNALLTRVAMIFGFYAEFSLKRKLTVAEEEKFKNEVFFEIGTHGEKASIKLLSNHRLQVNINKNYTVFGQFYLFTQSN